VLRASLRSPAAVAGLLGAFALALYAGSAGHGFVHDDTPLLLKNPYLGDLGNLGRFFASDYWAPTLVSGLYRPLVTTSFALDRAVGGMDPLGFHLVNLVLHAGVCVLVLGLVRRLVGDARLAAATAFLFAAHAVHTEVVANVSAGRPELLASLFLLASLRFHLAGRRLAAVGLFGLALLCKESAAAWLGVVYLTDLVYAAPAEPLSLGRTGRLLRQRLLSVYAVYALVLLAYLGVRLVALGLDASVPAPARLDNPLAGLDPLWRVVNAVWVLGRYALLLVLPLRLAYDYSHAQIPLLGPGDPRLVLVPLLCAAAVAGGVLAWRRSRDLFYALAFTGLTLFPVSNLALPIGTIMAERLLYLPSLGFCLALALALRRVAAVLAATPRVRRRLGVALVAGVVALHAGRSLERLPDWRSEDSLWLHDVEVVPRSARAQANAGAALERQGRCAEALAHFEAAIALGLPPQDYVQPYQGKALCLAELGRFAEAAELYAVVVRHGPPHPELERRIRRGLRESRETP
jgi:tetratricopeptide (TPR) repeat protein